MKKTRLTIWKLRKNIASLVISISLVLFLLGLTLLLILNTRKLSTYLKEHVGISVFLNNSTPEFEILRLQKKLDAEIFVKETRFISSQQAAEELQTDLGEDFLDILEYNPLPPSIEIKLVADYVHNDSLKNITQQILTYSGVIDVTYQKSLMHAINNNVNRISFVLLLFATLLFVVSIALINNTVRLSIYAKRFHIKTQKLVGATEVFIRQPFIKENIFYGIEAAFIAIILLFFVVFFLEQEVGHLFKIENVSLLFFLVLLCGIVITGVSSFFAVNKYLRINADELYF